MKWKVGVFAMVLMIVAMFALGPAIAGASNCVEKTGLKASIEKTLINCDAVNLVTTINCDAVRTNSVTTVSENLKAFTATDGTNSLTITSSMAIVTGTFKADTNFSAMMPQTAAHDGTTSGRSEIGLALINADTHTSINDAQAIKAMIAPTTTICQATSLQANTKNFVETGALRLTFADSARKYTPDGTTAAIRGQTDDIVAVNTERMYAADFTTTEDLVNVNGAGEIANRMSTTA